MDSCFRRNDDPVVFIDYERGYCHVRNSQQAVGYLRKLKMVPAFAGMTGGGIPTDVRCKKPSRVGGFYMIESNCQSRVDLLAFGAGAIN